jgi:FkbM family methyltransferase
MFDREKYILADLPIKKDILKLFSVRDNIIIFDIGGCEGEDSIRYSKLFPNSKIFVFEPLPSNQRLIKENLKRFNVKNVNLIQEALSDNISTEKFYVSSGSPNEMSSELNWDFGNKSSSLLPPDKLGELIPWLKFNDIIEVPTNTIKNFVHINKISNIDFIHMDVQGAELKVLNGANSFIRNIKAIWLEVSDLDLYKEQPKKNDIEIFMAEHNFTLLKTLSDGVNGDQLYINKKFFKLVKFLGFKKLIKTLK